MTEYNDGTIECAQSALRIRMYYFPCGTKSIPYSAVKAISRVDLGIFSGRARIWGTANISYWANLDPKRSKKHTGFIIDVGARVKPFITPSDPDAFESALRANTGIVAGEGESGPAPFI